MGKKFHQDAVVRVCEPGTDPISPERVARLRAVRAWGRLLAGLDMYCRENGLADSSAALINVAEIALLVEHGQSFLDEAMASAAVFENNCSSLGHMMSFGVIPQPPVEAEPEIVEETWFPNVPTSVETFTFSFHTQETR